MLICCYHFGFLKLKTMSAEEFLKETSPNDEFGIRADLNSLKITKHVLEIMRRFAKMHVTEALKCAAKASESFDFSEDEDLFQMNQENILTAYDLDNVV